MYVNATDALVVFLALVSPVSFTWRIFTSERRLAERVNGWYLASFSSWTLSNKFTYKQYKGQEDTGRKVIEATELKFDDRSYPGFKKPDSTQ